MTKLFATVISAVLSLSFAFSQQQGSQSRALTLDQALAIAFERNVNVAQAANSIENARSGVLTAYGSYIPKLSANAGLSRTGYNSPPSIRTIGGIPFSTPRSDSWYSTYSGGIGLSYVLFDGFSREASFSSAQTNEMQAEQSYDRTRQSIAYTVQSFYLNVIRSEKQVQVFLENLTNEKNRLQRITEQNRLGAVAIGDVYRQQSQVAQAEYNYINAQNTYDKAKADLLNLLALDVFEDYMIADPSIEAQIKEVESDPGTASLGSFEVLRKRALDSRLDYAIVKSNVSLADAGITQAWSNYYPSVSVNANYSTNAQEWDVATNLSENHSRNIGLNLSWQLPEIFGAMQRIQTASISKKNAVLQLEQKARDVSVELRKALLDIEASRKQYEASQKSLVAAGQDKRIAEERYNLGSGTLLDVQVATTAYLNAQVTTVFNSYNYITYKKNLELVIGEKKY
jgi:outer membrane protein